MIQGTLIAIPIAPPTETPIGIASGLLLLIEAPTSAPTIVKIIPTTLKQVSTNELMKSDFKFLQNKMSFSKRW